MVDNDFYIKKFRKAPSLNVSDSIAVIGMPGIANIGKILVTTAIESFNAYKLYDIYYTDFPAQVTSNSTGSLSSPFASIYAAELQSENRNLFFVTGDYQPLTHEGIYRFSYKIAQYLNDLNVKLAVATGAYMTNIITKKPTVYVSSTDKSLIEKIIKLPNTKIMSTGTIVGANGLIPAILGKKFNISNLCLLAETNPMVIVDPLASKTIANILNSAFDLNIKLDKLDDQIKKMEEFINEIESKLEHNKSDKSQAYIS